MVDCHPSESIVNLGSASVDNVSSGWQSTMSPRKKCDIYILLFLLWQYGNGTFNKGRIMNAAAQQAMAVYDFRCIIFHDVDLIPEDDRNMYSCKNQPFHLSVAIDQWKYM